MFQPETEDMLPRMAPKPSGTLPAEPTIRPQVPEVSILFGAPQQGMTNQQMPQNNFPLQQQTTSYAAWKKQILPRVTYPPSLDVDNPASARELIENNNNNNAEAYNMPRSTLYPLRAAIAPVVSMSLGGKVNSNVYMTSNGTQDGKVNSNAYKTSNGNQDQGVYNANNANVMANPVCYRRSLDSCNNANTNYQQPQQTYRASLESNNTNNNYQAPQLSYRPSVESTPPSTGSSARDVLTICAGTQTDTVGSPLATQQNGILTSVASKKDVDELKQIVLEIRNDQLRFMQILETFVFSQPVNNNRAVCKDAAVQVNYDEEASSPPILSGHAPITAPTNKFIEHLKPPSNLMQSPKGKPTAQSTTYRPNTPNRVAERQQIASPPPQTQKCPQMPANLQNCNTDTSLVMNELALKYLPNEKLAELLKELNIPQPVAAPANEPPTSQPPPIPLRNINNFERTPTDMSNASYKYMKKYCLLPEDQEEDAENHNPNQQYDGGRSSPVRQRPQPNAFVQRPNSPYQQQQIAGRLPPSPLVRAATTPPPKYRDNMLDLEDIKQQPKFL